MRKISISLFGKILLAVGLVFQPVALYAQEFPIAAGADSTFSGGAVYGGYNGLVAVCGNTTSPYAITAQLIGASPNYLIGSRISLGATGVPPGAVPEFDGTRYLLVWRDFSNTLQGHFIDTSGNLSGTTFAIASNVQLEQKFMHQLVLGDTVYLALYVKSDGYLYGQRIGKSGGLLGGAVQISTTFARDFSVAYDGTNFLTAWVKVIPDTDKDIYGQFISKTGALVGSNFLIDGGTNFSDNPTSLAFDGTQYLLAYHETPAMNTAWTIAGRFITTSGAVGQAFTICDSIVKPTNPMVASDKNQYFITWLQTSNGSLMGRFFDKSGTPIEPAFVVFGPSDMKIPFGGAGYGGGRYLAIATRLNSSMTDGDVYGRFIMPVTTDVETMNPSVPSAFVLEQNYPNPFNPSTVISYQLPVNSNVTLKVYDVIGREVTELVNEMKDAGNYEVTFDASKLASGVYFCRMQAGSFNDVKKLILIK